MKTAIATDAGRVSEHFGRCPQYTILDFSNGELVKRSTVENPGHHPGYLPSFLNDLGVKNIVAGGMGMKAQMLFSSFGISPTLGVSGSIEEVVSKLTSGQLAGGDSFCSPGKGKDYGLEKTECTHEGEEHEHNHGGCH